MQPRLPFILSISKPQRDTTMYSITGLSDVGKMQILLIIYYLCMLKPRTFIY